MKFRRLAGPPSLVVLTALLSACSSGSGETAHGSTGASELTVRLTRGSAFAAIQAEFTEAFATSGLASGAVKR